jgi:hypothetical protein
MNVEHCLFSSLRALLAWKGPVFPMSASTDNNLTVNYFISSPVRCDEVTQDTESSRPHYPSHAGVCSFKSVQNSL